MFAESPNLAVQLHQPPLQHSCRIAGRPIQNGANVGQPEARVAIGADLEQAREIPLSVAAVVPLAAFWARASAR